MRHIIIAALAMVALCGCATNPDGSRRLTEGGKVTLQEVAGMGVDRYVRETPRAAEQIEKIRAALVELQALPDITTVSGLHAIVQMRIDTQVSDPYDRRDLTRLANILRALLTDYVGSGQLESGAIVKVRDFLGYVAAALPLPPRSV